MWGIEWYAIDRGRWHLLKNGFRLNKYWLNSDTVGTLTDKDTGKCLIICKDFYGASQWRIA